MQKIIKRAKKHPDWYTAEDVRFAKDGKKHQETREGTKGGSEK